MQKGMIGMALTHCQDAYYYSYQCTVEGLFHSNMLHDGKVARAYYIYICSQLIGLSKKRISSLQKEKNYCVGDIYMAPRPVLSTHPNTNSHTFQF
jgi:hypothetical protein